MAWVPARNGGRALSIALLLGTARLAAAAPQQNPPTWPSSVRVFGPEDSPSSIQAIVERDFRVNGGHKPTDHGEFSEHRYAFLFKPGTYRVDVPVGYYTQVVGLGSDPSAVVFHSDRGVYCEEGDQSNMGGALNTFWRSAENFRTTSNMLWAASQGSPLRRIIVDKDLSLAQFVQGIGMGYASGGFLGNVRVDGVLHSGSQQQFCMRNAKSRAFMEGNWNMVYIGSEGAPPSHCSKLGGSASVNVPATPQIAEKPFVSVASDGKYYLQVPPMQRDRLGPDFDPGRSIGFEEVYVASPQDTAASINAHLREGLHVVLAPGIYLLEEPLVLAKDNQVLLGLGFATLVPTQGTAVVRVANVGGVRIAGVLLEAGSGSTDTLLEWGDGHFAGQADNPGFLHDVFARVGGPNDHTKSQVHSRVMVQINSGNVIGDNMWLWRADHDVAGAVTGGRNPSDHGLVVTGDDVTMYGLAVEHTLKDLVRWSGQRGKTFFLQAELPYDAPPAFGRAGYVGYRVLDTVAAHLAYGVGVYHFFRDHAVTVHQGIAAPQWLENSFEAPLSACLAGRGTMLHVLNDRGGQTGPSPAQVQWSCMKGPDVRPPSMLTPPPAADPALRGRSGEASSSSFTPWWWTFLVLVQSCLMVCLGAYVYRVRTLLTGEDMSPAAAKRVKRAGSFLPVSSRPSPKRGSPARDPEGQPGGRRGLSALAGIVHSFFGHRGHAQAAQLAATPERSSRRSERGTVSPGGVFSSYVASPRSRRPRSSKDKDAAPAEGEAAGDMLAAGLSDIWSGLLHQAAAASSSLSRVEGKASAEEGKTGASSAAMAPAKPAKKP